jgi:hypothetical protein
MNTVGTMFAGATPSPTPLQFLQAALSLATVVLQIMVLFLAIRLGRSHANVAFRYLMWACICYAVSEILVFATGFFPGFLFGRRAYFHLPWWFFVAIQISLIVFLVFLIRAIKCFIRDRHDVAKPNV